MTSLDDRVGKAVEKEDIVQQETEKGVSNDNKESKQVDIVTSLLPNENIDNEESPLTEGEHLATEEEIHTYRHVSQKIPWSVWLVAIIELAERFSYYGLSTPFQNYMANGPHDKPRGMLSLNQEGATGLSYFFQFWCYLSPVLGAWVADTYLGKLKTIMIFAVVYTIAIFILFITSFEWIGRTGSIAGYVVSIIFIGLATGGVKANVSPLIADQVPKVPPKLKVTKKGEKVIEDTNRTLERVFLFFYLMINIGSLSLIATTELELHVGFWAAFLLPFCFFWIAIITLFFGRKRYRELPVKDKVISKAFRIVWIVLRNKFNFNAAKPSQNLDKNYPWSDTFVLEVKRALYACNVFIFYPVYWVVYGQMINNFISLAGDMELHGFPSDILQVFDSIAVIIFIPVFERLLYPLIYRFTPFKPMTKIFWGFMVGSLAMVYAAVLQHYIYKAPPCYDMPMKCDPKYKETPNHIHVAIQTPAYVLIGISEIFANVTGLEYAYNKAPLSMKSFITSLYLVTNAFGSAIGVALSPVSKNPKMVWTYTGLAVSCFIGGCMFWILFHHYNNKDEELNKLEFNDEGLAVDNNLSPMNSHLSDPGVQPISSYSNSHRVV